MFTVNDSENLSSLENKKILNDIHILKISPVRHTPVSVLFMGVGLLKKKTQIFKYPLYFAIYLELHKEGNYL